MVGIYKVTNPKGKVYVGQSVDIPKRWVGHRNIRVLKSLPKFYNSVKKYGIEKHIFEVIVCCKIEELNDLERYYQEIYNSMTNGLNCKLTDTSTQKTVFSEETKQKISKALMGKKLSKEHIESLRKAQTGLKRSPEAIRKSIESRRGLKFGEEFKRNASKRQTGDGNSMAKWMLNTETGIYYGSLMEASKSTVHSYGMFLHYTKGRVKNKTLPFIYV